MAHSVDNQSMYIKLINFIQFSESELKFSSFSIPSSFSFSIPVSSSSIVSFSSSSTPSSSFIPSVNPENQTLITNCF